MTKEQVVLTFDQVGNVKIDAENFMGNTCEAATAPFEELFSRHGKRKGGQKKPEYYQSAGQGVGQTQKW